MDAEALYSRTGDSWRLAFVHASKLLHYLTRALLLSAASASLVLAHLFCWLDRFRSSRGATAWLIRPNSNPIPPAPPASGRQRPVEFSGRPYLQPRTIDSLIRNKEAHGPSYSSQQG
jgi:hypothetical protein